MKTLLTIAAAVMLFTGIAGAQAYKTFNIPAYSTVTAGTCTNNTSITNSGGYPALTAIRLPKKLTDGLTLSHSFSCATVTLAAVNFTYQGSVDGTNFHTIPGSLVQASIPASVASANPTNVCYTTNISQAALLGWNWIRIGGQGNGNAANLTGVVVTGGYWEP